MLTILQQLRLGIGSGWGPAETARRRRRQRFQKQLNELSDCGLCVLLPENLLKWSGCL